MITEMHYLTRDQDLVRNKKWQKWQDAKKVDPDSFPINKTSADLFEEYDSLWKVEKSLRKRLEARVGHSLRISESLIDHHGKCYFIQACVYV